MTDYATRAAVIAALEAGNRRRVAESLAACARYEAMTAAVNLAMQTYIDAITAPMRAFAEELRARPPR